MTKVREELLNKIKEIEARFASQKMGMVTEHDLANFKASFVGKKGEIADLIKNLGNVSADLRPEMGQVINQVKQMVEAECQKILTEIREKGRQKKIAEENLDVTLPGRRIRAGSLHPVTQIMEEVEDIFVRMGFEVHYGPEIETEFNNFDALNFLPGHPARDDHDTFYVVRDSTVIPAKAGIQRSSLDPRFRGDDERRTTNDEPLLLRTHTSPVQIHVMKKRKPPIRMIGPGAVYRRDFDVSHTPVFHQVEGLAVDTDITFSDMKGVLHEFTGSFFEKGTKVRFRPSFFPFTEPSAEMDISCVFCKGKGCRVCKNSGWIEIMGCGMVDPNVFKAVNYDPNKYTGFAFGMGIERMSMLKFGVNDIRLFFESDIRFLEQF